MSVRLAATLRCDSCDLATPRPDDSPKCPKCGGEGVRATGACIECGHDTLGYYDDLQSGDRS